MCLIWVTNNQLRLHKLMQGFVRHFFCLKILMVRKKSYIKIYLISVGVLIWNPLKKYLKIISYWDCTCKSLWLRQLLSIEELLTNIIKWIIVMIFFYSAKSLFDKKLQCSNFFGPFRKLTIEFSWFIISLTRIKNDKAWVPSFLS